MNGTNKTRNLAAKSYQRRAKKLQGSGGGWLWYVVIGGMLLFCIVNMFAAWRF